MNRYEWHESMWFYNTLFRVGVWDEKKNFYFYFISTTGNGYTRWWGLICRWGDTVGLMFHNKFHMWYICKINI